MDTLKLSFENFLFDVHLFYHSLIAELHEYMLGHGFLVKLVMARNGYVVSYHQPKSKRVALNYVFRKGNLMARIYGDHVADYPDVLESLPESMRLSIEKAPVCKRLVNPDSCSSRCPMGYAFVMKGTPYKRCRYNCFMFQFNDESVPYIKAFIEKEVEARVAALAL